jgi:NAD(P)-dependent dehydrogenase (short-subunit alcohol dehydrogenase family)
MRLEAGCMAFLIYGATGAIGGATARRLFAAGHKLHLVARDADRLGHLARELNATCTAGDLADGATIGAATEAAMTDAGVIEGLVYAIGTVNLKPLGRLTEADFRADFEVNALRAVLAVQAAIPALRKGDQTSSIVLFSTIAVGQGFTAHASISMAKGAVEGLTRALAAELAPKIRVNCIAPSLVRSRLSAGLVDNEALAKAIAGMHPLPRIGEGDDIGPLAAFLAGPDSSWITGEIFHVDGGRSRVRTKG